MPNSSCRTKAEIFGNVGLTLILAGFIGFIATVSTAEDDKPAASVEVTRTQPEEKRVLKLPPGVHASDVSSGSAAPSPAP